MTGMNDPKSYDMISGAALLVGFWEGLVPFPAKAFGWTPIRALPVRMPAPAWWVVSGLVLVVALLVVWRVDAAKKARFPGG